MNKLMYTLGALSSMAFVAGWTFGMLHLPGASELSVYGFLGFAFLFMPLYAAKYDKARMQRLPSEKWRLFLGMTSAMLIGASLISKMMHLSVLPAFFLIAGSTIFIFGFIPFLFFSLYKKSVS